MVVTMESKPIDKYILANLVRTFGLPVPPLMMGLGMAFHQKLESIGMKAIQSYLDNNGWYVQLHSLELLSDDNYQHIYALRVEGTVTDYPKTIAKMMPFLKEKLRKEPQMETALEILDIIGDDLEPTLEQAALFHHAQKMTKMAGMIVRETQDKLCEHLNQLLAQNEIPVEITAIRISE